MRDRVSWILLSLVALMCGLNVGFGVDIVTRFASIVALIICTLAYGSHRTALWFTKRREPDGTIVLERDTDGHATAFITHPNGDPEIVNIPDEISEQGPDAAMTWLLNREEQ